MGVYIRKTDEMPGMREALQKLAGISEFEAYRFFDDFAGFHKEYDAYKVIHPEGTLILKRRMIRGRLKQSKRFTGCARGCVFRTFTDPPTDTC